MAIGDFTQLDEEARHIDFGLYQIRSDATALDVVDQIHARLSQLSAMLLLTFGEGAETFRLYSSKTHDAYLENCHTAVSECEELMKFLWDRHLKGKTASQPANLPGDAPRIGG